MATAYDDYMAQIAQSRQDVGQRIAGLPEFETSLREKVYGTEQALPSLRSQVSDKIRQLYDADKRAADVYSARTSPLYIRDPYEWEKLISSQHQAELGEIQDLQKLIGQRQDVLGSGIEKGLQIYQAGIDAAKWQHSSLLDELNAAMKIDAARRAAGRAGTGTGTTTYTNLVRILGSQAPTDTPPDPNEVRSISGWDYAWDANAGKWYATDLGDLSRQADLLTELAGNPKLDAALGQGVYEAKFLPTQPYDTQWEYNVGRTDVLTALKQEIQQTQAGNDARTAYQNVVDAYGTDLSTKELGELENFIYDWKGQTKLEF